MFSNDRHFLGIECGFSIENDRKKTDFSNVKIKYIYSWPGEIGFAVRKKDDEGKKCLFIGGGQTDEFRTILLEVWGVC